MSNMSSLYKDLVNIAKLSVLIYVLIEIIDGYLYVTYNFSYFANLYRVLFIIFVFGLVLIFGKFSQIFFVLLAMVLAALALLRLLVDPSILAVVFDLSIYIRSQLYTIAIILLFCELYRLPEKNRNSALIVFKQYFVITWLVIFGALYINIFTGFGQSAYKIGEGYKSCFRSANEMTFVFVSAWWVMSATARSVILKVSVTVATVVTLFLIGTKSGLLIVAVMLYITLLYRLTRRIKQGIHVSIIISTVMVLFATQYFDHILDLTKNVLLEYSSSSDRLNNKLMVAGVASALVSQRDLLVGKALEIIGTHSPWEIVIGPGYYSYATNYNWGVYNTEGMRIAENDLIDLFGGGGLIAIITYYLPIILSALLLLTRRKRVKAYSVNICGIDYGNILLGLLGIYVLGSMFTGHVAMQGFPTVGLALLIAMGFILVKSSACLRGENHADCKAVATNV